MLDAGAAGSWWSLYKLVEFYRYGAEVPRNKKKSLALYHRMEENVWNNFYLGQMYENGEGCRVNYYESINHYTIFTNRTNECYENHIDARIGQLREFARVQEIAPASTERFIIFVLLRTIRNVRTSQRTEELHRISCAVRRLEE